MRLIYLASPYSTKDEDELDARVKAVQSCCARIAKNLPEIHVYSPISHWHQIAKNHELPKDFRYWQEHDFFMIRKSFSMWVLPLPGWKESFGVMQEIEYCHDIQKPVLYVTYSQLSVVVSPTPPPVPVPLD